MNQNLITRIIQRPNRNMATISVDVDMSHQYFSFSIMERITEALAEKAVKEIWKKHGATILKKVDKKTIGNLTVKKLSTLIASELNPNKKANHPNT